MAKPKGYYKTLDCRDGAHSACATCFCECHVLTPTPEQGIAVKPRRKSIFSKKNKPDEEQKKRSTFVEVGFED